MEDNGSTTKGLLGSSSSDVTAPPKREDETEPDEEDDDDDGDEEDVVVVVVEPDGRDTSGESEEDTNDGTVSSSFGEGNRARFPTATSGGQLTLSSIIRLLLVVYSIHNQSTNQSINQRRVPKEEGACGVSTTIPTTFLPRVASQIAFHSGGRLFSLCI